MELKIKVAIAACKQSIDHNYRVLPFFLTQNGLFYVQHTEANGSLT